MHEVKIGPYRIIKVVPHDQKVELANKMKSANTLVQGILPVEFFPSVNWMYGHNIHTGKKFLKPQAEALRKELKSRLSKQFTGNEVSSDERLSITLGFMMNYDIEKRDVDNCQKFIQDTLAEFFKFNDNRIFDTRGFKVGLTNPNIDKEILFFRIEKNVKPDEAIYINLANVDMI